jgi:orotidine-5'-phosphate decarboxylase
MTGISGEPGRASADLAQAGPEPFGKRLDLVTRLWGPLCVGIDPHPELLLRWGLDDDAAGLERFSRTVVEALVGVVPVLKPQSAFFERHGSRGIAVLEGVLAELRSTPCLTIVDAKRGDIGSTMAAYGDAYAGAASPLAGDAVTVSPYLGFGSLRPLLDRAAATGRGVFVLALTSNDEGPEVQHARRPDGRTVAQAILDDVAAANAGAEPAGSMGVVVGATVTGDGRAHDFSRLNGPILAPGVGAQGGTAADLADVFGDALPRVLASTSREVLGAGPAPGALRDAAERARDAVAAVLG